jgi:hypothetical protein
LNQVSDELAQNLIDALGEALVTGSYLLVGQITLELPAQGAADVIAKLNHVLDERYYPRTKGETGHFLEGFDLLDPGLVPVEQWRPDGDPPFLPDGQLIPIYGALCRKA